MAPTPNSVTPTNSLLLCPRAFPIGRGSMANLGVEFHHSQPARNTSRDSWIRTNTSTICGLWWEETMYLNEFEVSRPGRARLGFYMAQADWANPESCGSSRRPSMNRQPDGVSASCGRQCPFRATSPAGCPPRGLDTPILCPDLPSGPRFPVCGVRWTFSGCRYRTHRDPPQAIGPRGGAERALCVPTSVPGNLF